jgi:hypothetical protein
MGSVPRAQRVRALQALGLWCRMELTGTKPPPEILEELNFNSVEDMEIQLDNWKLRERLLDRESETRPAKKELPKSLPQRLRDAGPRKDLPPAANAADLFKERLEVLRESVELLEHINEGLYGKYFGRTNVETASVLHAGHWTDDAVVSLPGTVARSPTEIEVTLIGVYALAGGRMDLLLEKLHLDPSSVDAKTREKIRQCIEGSRADRDAKDGLKVLARQLATWVRGGEVGTGRPSELPEMDHAVASIITKYRKDGLTDEQIAGKLAHLKKVDGTSYSVEDITELGDLGLSWP